MKIKKKYISIFAVVAVAGMLMPLKVDYKIYSTGRVFPEREWTLGRTDDGRVISTIKNNKLGIISSYGGKEFQRGDVFDFAMNPELAGKKFVKEGEFIGGMYSNDLQRMLVELEGQLKVEKALLGVYSSGSKTQVVNEAQTSLVLAKEQFEIKRKILDRKKKLFDDSLLAPQEYDLALNDYETCRINHDLAQAKLQTVSTGEKPEQLMFSQQRILSLSNQVETLKQRLKALQITAPFSGMILQKKSAPSLFQTNTPYVDLLTNVADTSVYIIVTPIQLKEAKYLREGQKMMLKLFNSDAELEAEVSNVDNVIQIINGKQAMFVTAILKKSPIVVMPGIIAQTSIITDELTVYEYAQRLIAGVFYR